MSNSELNSNTPVAHTKVELQRRLFDNLYYAHGQAVQSASKHDLYVALSYAIRDYLIDRWRRTSQAHYRANAKFVYYLSAEYLLGKQLEQNLLYTGMGETARELTGEFLLDLDEFLELDVEPGLGNGGLGRLAACYIDSLATLDIPCIGYGIRYEFGIFKQSFENGWQKESPDEWSLQGNPWQFVQSDDLVKVGFGGHTEFEPGGVRWIPAQQVLGQSCTMLVPGYNTNTVNRLRLWQARASEEFDFQLFDVGDYTQAVEQKIQSENISKVLYPNDNTPQGKELRLKQQYFFVACSLWDIVRRFRENNDDWNQLPHKAVMQLNDTHPVVAIPELMRILMDQQHLPWDQAWQITQQTCAYTCHTLLPEALEKWTVELFARLLPRHLEIIYEINRRFLDEVRLRFPGDNARVARMSIIEEHPVRQVRMAHLAAVGSFAINGVAELHSRLLQEHTLHDFFELWPDRFQNKTNGVTPRRFMRIANPRLSKLIDEKLGPRWLNDLDQLQNLRKYAANEDFCRQWQEIKLQNKHDVAELIQTRMGIRVNQHSLFDVMVKRLHEYKRQLLKVLHIITLYRRLKSSPDANIFPRTFIFGAKAAPGYFMAKRIIKLINNVGSVINHDPQVHDRLKVIFVPNFNVSSAQKIYPAADISEQISLAGKEASGTGNMKFALNGAITVGTLDGANVEIRQHVGEENFFLFGLTADEVFALKRRGYSPWDYYHANAELKGVIDSIADGQFSDGDRELFRPIVDSLLQHDEYLLLADYESYIQCSEQAAEAYRDRQRWTKMSILNAAGCGFFSSDRAIQEYCRDIWKVQPVKVEVASAVSAKEPTAR